MGLLFLGLPEAAESEGFDRDTLDMPAKQIALLEQVAATNQNVVVVLSNGSVVSVAPWAKNAKGILESWLLGQAGGLALADVIFGQVSPSGKLAQSIPLDINDDPSMLNWPGEEGHVDYGEGVFVGYRYYDTYGKSVDYPFGYGLSYATFEIADVAAAKTGANTATVTATVTNTSDVAAAGEAGELTKLLDNAMMRMFLNSMPINSLSTLLGEGGKKIAKFMVDEYAKLAK